ncbi:gustatory receptor for bitter taste 22e-like [Eupeodes corollae]|uniref:gustatory receptor for bitter taste 22e-like n=1 Tax=Eupeodes corollae TaxID=290404 RepID=UPI0024939C0B|nr:gustatory receptor for bitter taste 22e-like [Eupeodes corollae]
MHSGEDPDGKLLFYTFRYLIYMGISAHDYDYNTKKLIYKQWAGDYCAVVDCFFLVTGPFYTTYISKYLRCEVFMTRYTAMYMNCLILMAQFIGIALSRFGNWLQRKQTIFIYDELNKIRLTEFPFPRERFNKIRNEIKMVIYSKILCSCFVTLGLSAIIVYQSKGGLVIDYYWAVLSIFVLIILIAMENQICVAMIFGAYIFKMLNCRLVWVVEEINSLCEKKAEHIVNRKTGLLCYEMKNIGRIHTSVLSLIIKYKDTVNMHILLIMSSIILSQVYYAYIFLILLNGTYSDGEFQKMCAFATCFISFVDLWLMVYICGDVIESCDSSGKTLGSLSTYNKLNKQLETRVQILTYQFIREKMELMIFGMFNLNWATGFVMTGVAVEYLIILVQFDYHDFDF